MPKYWLAWPTYILINRRGLYSYNLSFIFFLITFFLKEISMF